MHHSSSFVLGDEKNCQVSWDYKYLIIICMLRTIDLAPSRTFIKPELFYYEFELHIVRVDRNID